MNEPRNEPASENCPPECDWLTKGFHFEHELMRISGVVDRTHGKIDTLQQQLEVLIKSNKTEMDIAIRRYIDESTRQIMAITESVRANANLITENAANIREIKLRMARTIAIWASIAGAIVAAIPAVIHAIQGIL
jgi:hypothetical protein